MVDVTGSARRLYHRLVKNKSKQGEMHPGINSAAAGHTAVAMTEALVSEASSTGGSFPADEFTSDLFKLESEERLNLWDRPQVIREGSGTRGSLAATMGSSMAGMRATAFLAGNDFSECIDLLARATGRRLPFVLHLAARVRAGHASSGGGSHDPLHAAAETGAPVLVAGNVQEAVDFTLIARRLAEDALTPVVAAMDGEETALSVQDLHLPDPLVVRRFVGDPDQSIHPPAASQELLFGRHRRRVPRWHDPERPFLSGSSEGPREYAMGEAGRYAYFDSHTPDLLSGALVAFESETGRLHSPVSEFRMNDAELVLIGMGSVIESLEATAEHLRQTRKLKVGVIGIRVLRPFPAARIAELLSGRKTVAVCERVSPQRDAQPPLLRDIQTTLDRAHQNARYGETTHPEVPVIESRDLPRLATVYYGLAGSPIRSADLEALCTELSSGFRSPIFLGLRFSPTGSEYPKRQVLLDRLKRHYPGTENLGLRADGSGTPPENELRVEVHRMAGRGGDQLAGEVATTWHRLEGGHVRTRSSSSWDRWGAGSVDRCMLSADPVRDRGEDTLCRVAVWAGDGLPPGAQLAGRIAKGGAILIERDPGMGSFLESLPPALRQDVLEKNLKIYAVKSGDDGTYREERILGALLGVLQKEGLLEVKSRQLLAARRDILEDLAAHEKEARVLQLQAGFDVVMPVEASAMKGLGTETVHEDVEAPRVVRRLRRIDEAGDSLARFWDQVGVLYRRGEMDELVPDPYLASGIIPPLSSSFRNLSSGRNMFPSFDPALCTGCGDCWSACPDSSMTPLVISAQKLIETGMSIAKDRGEPADAMRMTVSKLSGRVNEVLSENPSKADAGEVLDEAYTRLMKRMTIPEDRKQDVENAFRAMRDSVSRLPLARTGPFFEGLEAEKKGTGELFSMAMSPDACKGCALCVAVCEPNALISLPEDSSRSRSARKLWELFEALPDPTDETLERARDSAAVGPVAAAMLTRAVRESFAGGDGAEPGSGEKTALRELLAVAYSRLTPQSREYLQTVESVRDQLGEAIRVRMAKALPTQDLEALSEGLSSLERPETNLAELSTRMETAFDSGRVDVPEMQRLVEVAKEINDLHWRLTQGEGGLGRTPFGVVIGPGTASAWASTFPNNPFGVPVTIDAGGETAELALGLLEGQLQSAAAEAGVLRRANLELDNPKDAGRFTGATRRLTWRDLSADERKWAPPLFLVIDERVLSRGLGGLSRLLNGDLPVKVVVLSEVDLGFGADLGASSPAGVSGWSPADLAFLAMAHGNAFVAQTSVANPVHLDRSVIDALAYDGPALIRMHTPSPERHGFPKDMGVHRAKDAVRSRAFPLFRYDPSRGMNQVELDGNPEESSLTLAEWALGEKRFADAFYPAPLGAKTIALPDYLDLDSEDRVGKTPVIETAEGTSLAVMPEVIEASETALIRWETLEGMIRVDETTETDLVEAARMDELAQQHAAELAAVQGQYETQIQDLGMELRVDMARKVRGRLLNLLQRRASNGGDTSAEPGEEN